MIVDIGCGRRPHGDINIDVVRTQFCSLVASAEQLPIRSDSAGKIFCSHVLEHLDDPRKALSEINRVLAPNGVSFISFPKPEFCNLPKLRLIEFFVNLPSSLFPISLKTMRESLLGIRQRRRDTFHKFVITSQFVRKYLNVTDIRESKDIFLQALNTLGISQFIRKPRFNIELKLTCRKKLVSEDLMLKGGNS